MPPHLPSSSVSPLRDPSPSKRPKISTPAPTLNPQLDPQLDAERRASSSRLLNVWRSLEQKYARHIDDDDIIDLCSGRLVKDRGVLSGKAGKWDIGCFVDPVDEGVSPGGEDEAEADGDVDELDVWGSDDGVNYQFPAMLQPVRKLNAEDAEDLRAFLEAEENRKNTQGVDCETSEFGGSENEQDAEYEVDTDVEGSEITVEVEAESALALSSQESDDELAGFDDTVGEGAMLWELHTHSHHDTPETVDISTPPLSRDHRSVRFIADLPPPSAPNDRDVALGEDKDEARSASAFVSALRSMSISPKLKDVGSPREGGGSPYRSAKRKRSLDEWDVDSGFHPSVSHPYMHPPSSHPLSSHSYPHPHPPYPSPTHTHDAQVYLAQAIQSLYYLLGMPPLNAHVPQTPSRPRLNPDAQPHTPPSHLNDNVRPLAHTPPTWPYLPQTHPLQPSSPVPWVLPPSPYSFYSPSAHLYPPPSSPPPDESPQRGRERGSIREQSSSPLKRGRRERSNLNQGEFGSRPSSMRRNAKDEEMAQHRVDVLKDSIGRKKR